MTHFKMKHGILAALTVGFLTGCTQFQTSLANPGGSSSNSSTTGVSSLGSSEPVIQRAGLATSLAQIFSGLSQSVPGFSASFGSMSCQTVSDCTSGSSSAQTITSSCSSQGFSGQTVINYSAPSCSVFNSTSIGIAPELQFGSVQSISAAASTDYRGVSMGGGYEISYSMTSGTASFAEPGIHLVNTSSSPFDFSSRTTAPISIALNFSDLTLSVNGGSLELIDNANQYTATVAADDLTFDSTCACPVSGTLNGTLSGTFSGSVSMTFNSCGSMTIDTQNVSSTVTVSSCHL